MKNICALFRELCHLFERIQLAGLHWDIFSLKLYTILWLHCNFALCEGKQTLQKQLYCTHIIQLDIWCP